jgi:mRNA interferase RelE/StbE
VYRIQFAKSVVKDLKPLPKKIQRRALEIIEHDLATDPRRGTQLRGHFRRLWKYRVGDYRIIYAIEREHVVITVVLRIRHRKDVYKGVM